MLFISPKWSARIVMAPRDPDPAERAKSSLDDAGDQREWVDRAERRLIRLPLRYRKEGQENWQAGETINVSETGILFTSNEMLEVDAQVEITFQTSGAPLLQSSTRLALVVRRVLSNWPETRLIFGARYRA
jgi:PilZ domain